MRQRYFLSPWSRQGFDDLSGDDPRLTVHVNFIYRRLPECHDAVVQRQLMYANFHGAVTTTLATIPVDEIGHALTNSLFLRIGDFEMQMRLTGITRIADARQYLASPHAVPGLPPQAPRLRMMEIRKLAAPRHGGVDCWSVSGDVFRNPISRRDRARVSHRQHVLPVGVIGVHVARVARE